MYSTQDEESTAQRPTKSRHRRRRVSFSNTISQFQMEERNLLGNWRERVAALLASKVRSVESESRQIIVGTRLAQSEGEIRAYSSARQFLCQFRISTETNQNDATAFALKGTSNCLRSGEHSQTHVRSLFRPTRTTTINSRSEKSCE